MIGEVRQNDGATTSRMPTKCDDCSTYVYDIGNHRKQFHPLIIKARNRGRKRKENFSSGEWTNAPELTVRILETALDREESSGERRFKCVYCKEVFGDNESREKHEKRHPIVTTEKAEMGGNGGSYRSCLRCLQCGRVCENRPGLLKHLRFHHRYYHCLHCGKSFSDRAPILRHVQETHGNDSRQNEVKQEYSSILKKLPPLQPIPPAAQTAHSLGETLNLEFF